MQMDEDVSRRMKDLLDSVRNSSAYRDFEKAREELSCYPDRKQKADQFRREKYIVRNFPADDTMGQRADVSKTREQLRLDPLIDRYLNTELVLCRMLKNCALQILNCADFDLEHMDDIL